MDVRVGALVEAAFVVYYWLIFARIVMSWFRPNTYSSFYYDLHSFVERLTEPYLGIFRRMIPPVGAIDFSPMIALIALDFIRRIVISALY